MQCWKVEEKKIDFWDCTFFVRCSILIVIVSMVGKRFREFRQIMGTPSIYHQKKCIKKVPIFYLARSSKQLPFTDKYLLSSSSVHNPDNIWNWISKIFFHTYFLIKMRAHVPFSLKKHRRIFVCKRNESLFIQSVHVCRLCIEIQFRSILGTRKERESRAKVQCNVGKPSILFVYIPFCFFSGWSRPKILRCWDSLYTTCCSTINPRVEKIDIK